MIINLKYNKMRYELSGNIVNTYINNESCYGIIMSYIKYIKLGIYLILSSGILIYYNKLC